MGVGHCGHDARARGVPAARAGRPGAGLLRTSGASETEVTSGGAVRLLSGRAEMLLSQ